MKTSVIKSVIIIFAITTLNVVPLFFYANSWILLVNSVDIQEAWYAWYLAIPDIVGIFFAIGTLPLMYYFLQKNDLFSLIRKYISWFLLCFLTFNLASIVGIIIGMIPFSIMIYVGIMLGIALSCFILMHFYSKIVSLWLSLSQKIQFSMIWCFIWIIGMCLFGFPTTIWTWWNIIAVRMYSIFFFHFIMSLVLFYFTTRAIQHNVWQKI